MIRKLLNSKKGEGYLDVVVGVVALAMFIVVALNIFTFVSLKTTMDRIADDLIEVATYSGAFGEDFDLKVDQLKAKYFDFDVEVYTEEYFNTEHKRVQMGEDMGITIKVNSSVAGIDIALPIDLTVSRVGQSEQYWRVASGVYEEPEIDYTGKTLFVLNTSTGKFHYPHCSLVPSIKEENKKEVYSTAEELTALGYSSCGTCDAHDCSTNVVTHFNVYGHWGYCEICGRQDEIEKHWWTYDEKLDQYYCEYCEAIENKDGNYACSNGSLLTEEAHPMGCGCNLTPPTLTVNGLSTDSANPTILEQAGIVRITGIAKDREGAVLAVTVNGVKAKLFADGEWYYDLDFNNTTSNTITVVAIDEDGMETTVNCYAELPVTLVTITQANKYEIMDAIGVDYTLTGYPLTIPEYYFVGDTKYKIIGIGDQAFRNENVGTVLIKGANRDYFTIGGKAFSGTTICELKIESASIKSFGDYAFANCTELITAQIPGSKNPGYGTFSGCTALTNVYLSDSITELGDEMFYDCVALRQIDLKNVTSIGTMCFFSCELDAIDLTNIKHIYWYAFASCTELIEVSIPNLTTWEIGVFMGCNSLERVTIASGNTCIPEASFDGCTSLESVSCPNSTIQEIGPYAFYDCGNYMPSTWTFQSPLTTIGDYAFYGCPSITEFVFNEEIEYIGENAFYVDSEIETTLSGTINSTIAKYDWTGDNRAVETIAGIYYENGNFVAWDDAVEAGYISVSNNIVMESDPYAMFGDGDNPGSIVLPDDISMINNYAFSSCAGLTGVSMSKNSDLSFIGAGAFEASHDLQSVILSNNVSFIGNSAFAYCSGIESISFPQNLQQIGNNTFAECNLTEIIIPSSTTRIGETAFAYNSNLTIITFEGEMEIIGDGAFANGSDTETYVWGVLSDAVHDYDWEGSNRYTGAVATITVNNRTAFGYVEGMTGELVIRDVCIRPETGQIVKPAFIGTSAFEGTNIAWVTMPNSITQIGSRAFKDCKQLSQVVLSNNAQTLEAHAFSGCTNLSVFISTSDTILYSITAIQMNAFYNCSQLRNITVPNVAIIGNYAFRNCTSLNAVYWGSKLTSIGNYAFDGCTALYVPTFPTTLTTIGAYAFRDCTNISSITIPSSVTSVGGYAFLSCTSLNSLVWKAPCNIPDFCFSSASLGEIVITNATGIGSSAFNNAIKNNGSVSVQIPNSVTFIDDYAFTGCTGIKSFYMGYAVSMIGDRAFQGCTGMTTFTISSGSALTSVGTAAWMNTGLTSMTTLGNARNLTALPAQAFASSKLNSVTIPVNIKTIGAGAFGNCTALTSATLEEDENLSLVTSPWYVSTSSSATSGTSITRIQAINTSTAANLLRNTYVNYYWFRRSA